MKTTFIYALKELSPGEFFSTKIRYIGKADDPYGRFETHSNTKEKNHRGNWIRSLPAKGLSLQLEILDEVPWGAWKFWEREYIRIFRTIGFALTNQTIGGDGVMSGRRHTPQACEKMSAARNGKKRAPEAVLKTTAKNTGQKRTPAQCAAISAAKLGHKQAAETVAKRIAKVVGQKRTFKQREVQSIIRFGKKKTNNTSGFVGVSWHAITRKWAASFTIRQKTMHVGLFAKIEDAVFARALAVALQ